MACKVTFDEMHNYKVKELLSVFVGSTKLERSIISKLADKLDTDFYIEVDTMSMRNSIRIDVYRADNSILSSHSISFDKNIAKHVDMSNPYHIKNAEYYSQVLYLDYVDKNIDVKLDMLAGV